MLSNKSPIYFTRTSSRKNIFSWPVFTFRLTYGQDGPEMGQLSVGYYEVEYTDPLHRDDFRIKKNFWGNRWVHVGDANRTFARTSIGFRHTITLADGTRYRMRVKRNWRFFTQKVVDDYTHLALFFRDETEVMRLENQAPLPIFGSDVTAPMNGTIRTGLSDSATMAAMLLLFQTYLTAGRNAAASAG